MDATLLLANSAETAPTGLVYALGLGWSVTSTPTPPAALVVLIKVPWSETNSQHQFTIRLVDTDGHDVMLGQDQAGNATGLQMEGQFEAGRPPGLPHGTAIDQILAVNLGPGMPLQPGQTYQWRLEINGEEAATATFFVRPEGS